MPLNDPEVEALWGLFRQHPTEFLRYHWPDIALWPKLEQLVEAVASNPRVAVRAGHGTGKTFILARIALWWLYSFPPAKVVTTAPTWSQVSDLLWRELESAYKTAAVPMGGRLLQTELTVGPEWFAIGISPQDTVSERSQGTVKGQGYHSPNLLVILDEAPGVPPSRWDTLVDSLPTGSHNHVVAVGNPTSPSGRFYDCFTKPGWATLSISCLDHPNVVEGRDVIPGAVSREWVEDKRRQWGDSSPLWQAKVLGEFPTEGTDSLFPLGWLEEAVRFQGKPGPWRYGIDVARFGDDSTVYARVGGEVAEVHEVHRKEDTQQTAGRIAQLWAAGNVQAIGVDDSGVGGGVTDRLNEQDIPVEPFNFGSGANEPDRFANRRAEVYWHLHERLNPKSEQRLSLPDDDELKQELSATRLLPPDGRGRIRLAAKDDIKRAIGRSPDKADALAIANAVGTTPSPTLTIL